MNVKIYSESVKMTLVGKPQITLGGFILIRRIGKTV